MTRSLTPFSSCSNVLHGGGFSKRWRLPEPSHDGSITAFLSSQHYLKFILVFLSLTALERAVDLPVLPANTSLAARRDVCGGGGRDNSMRNWVEVKVMGWRPGFASLDLGQATPLVSISPPLFGLLGDLEN